MDKINETIAWLMLVMFGCWLTKTEVAHTADKSEPEAAPAIGPASSLETVAARPDTVDADSLQERSIISVGLSEMLNKRRARRNMGRRKEDQQTTAK